MKKTLAVILSLIMLVCCIPFSANAAEEGSTIEIPEEMAEGTTWEITKSNQLLSEKYYTVKSGAVLYIKAGVTAYVPSETRLTIEPGAILCCFGNLVVLDEAQVLAQGTVLFPSNIIANTEDHGVALAEIRFPDLDDDTVKLKGKLEVSYGYSEEMNSNYADLSPNFVWHKVPEVGQTVTVPLNSTLFVKAHIIDPEDGTDKYDDSLMDVYYNSNAMTCEQGVHYLACTTAADISYTQWISDNYFLNTFKIYLPSGEGYTVYGRDGEQTAEGETVKLKYGQPFSFRVEIDPEYDMSVYQVYVYNAYGYTALDPSKEDLSGFGPAVSDTYGYYTIDSITSDHTIKVEGVMANSTIIMVGDILGMVKTIFEMITGFFAEIAAFFGISLGGTTA